MPVTAKLMFNGAAPPTLHPEKSPVSGIVPTPVPANTALGAVTSSALTSCAEVLPEPTFDPTAIRINPVDASRAKQ
jgi:hypothetical protein